MIRRAVPLLLVLTLAAAPVSAQDPVVAPHSTPPPAELADPIEALLATGGQHVTIGDHQLDFWWVKSMPLRSGSAEKDWSAVEEGTLVGAVRLSAQHNDIRGKPIKPGIYTLRYALQPENGNHLGVSPYRDFLLFGPVLADSSPSAIGHDASVELGKAATGAGHPGSWSIDPPAASGPPGRVYKNDAGLRGVVFQVPISRDGKDLGVLTFGLIVAGEVQP